jgi:hypothetical protein
MAVLLARHRFFMTEGVAFYGADYGWRRYIHSYVTFMWLARNDPPPGGSR